MAKQYFKKQVPVTVYCLWIAEDFKEIIDKRILKMTANTSHFSLHFQDDMSANWYLVLSKDEAISKDSKWIEDTVICVAFDRQWLTDRKYLEENYELIPD